MGNPSSDSVKRGSEPSFFSTTTGICNLLGAYIPKKKSHKIAHFRFPMDMPTSASIVYCGIIIIRSGSIFVVFVGSPHP